MTRMLSYLDMFLIIFDWFHLFKIFVLQKVHFFQQVKHGFV